MMRRLLTALTLLVAVGAGVATASIVVPAGSDTSGEPASVEPGEGPAYLDGQAADPQGGPPWTTRRYTSRSGYTCTQAGRVSEGRFGRVDADGSFTELPIAAAGTCTPPQSDSLVVAVNRYPRPDEADGRTVVFGIADESVAGLELQTPSGTRQVERGAGGGFVVVDGSLLRRDVILRIDFVDGSSKQFRLDRPAP